MLPEWPVGTVAVLAVPPGAIPVSTAIPAGEARVLLALAPRRGSLARLRDDPRAALAILAEGVAVTLHGRARVVAEELPGAEAVAAVCLDVDAVQDHDQPAFAVEEGVRWRWTDAEAARRDAAVRDALQTLAGRLPPP
jgi:hypothetical protein